MKIIKDIEGVEKWAGEAIRYSLSKHYAELKPDGTFKPQKEVARGRAIEVLVSVGNIPVVNESSGFIDSRGHWSDRYIASVQKYNEKAVHGYSDGYFLPNRPISRQELAKLIVILFDLEIEEDKTYEFSDNNDSEKEYIEILVSLGIMNGYPDRTVRPERKVTRAELAVLIHRLQNKHARKHVTNL